MILTPSIFADQNNKWEGIYTFNEESWDENHVRSSRWFRLEVKKKESQTMIATYEDGENSKTWRKFSLTVVTAYDKAVFYVNENLTTSKSRCPEDTPFRKGFLLLKLIEKGNGKNGKPIIQTFWGKENLGSRSETGGLQKDNIFFKKIN